MQTILISGASSGIGQALAMHYAMSAKTLILLGRNPLRMEQTHKACQRAGLEIISHLGDVNDQRSMHTFLQPLLQTHSIDIAFLNAGQSAKQARQYEDCHSAQSQDHALINSHLHGMINMLHPIMEKMQQQKSGHIVFMSSLNAFIPLSQSPIYGAVKAAVLHYGLALYPRLKKQGVNVSIICPGFVKSRLTKLNPFKMPGLLEAPCAAKIIDKGLKKKKLIIGFPWRNYTATRCFALLPKSWQIALLNKMFGHISY